MEKGSNKKINNKNGSGSLERSATPDGTSYSNDPQAKDRKQLRDADLQGNTQGVGGMGRSGMGTSSLGQQNTGKDWSKEHSTERKQEEERHREKDNDKYLAYAQEEGGIVTRNAEGMEETQDNLDLPSRGRNREPYTDKSARDVSRGTGRVEPPHTSSGERS